MSRLGEVLGLVRGIREDIQQIDAFKQKQLVDFVKMHAGLDDSAYHAYAQRLGINPHEAEEVIYDYVNRSTKTEERAARCGSVAVSLVKEKKRAKKRRQEAQEIPGGKARFNSPSDFNPSELMKGIDVEREHLVGGGYSEIDMRNKAREIAMDHLKEIPDYYTRLKRMEKEAGITD